MNKTVIWIAILIILGAAGYYCYKNWDYIKITIGITSNTKAFKITGDPVGTYTEGDIVIAENQTFKKRDPQLNEVVVYQKDVNGQTTEAIGEIIGLPGQTSGVTFVPTGYYLVQKSGTELVPRNQIIWLVTKRAI